MFVLITVLVMMDKDYVAFWAVGFNNGLMNISHTHTHILNPHTEKPPPLSLSDKS